MTVKGLVSLFEWRERKMLWRRLVGVQLQAILSLLSWSRAAKLC
jgi:hypothetical protein